VLFDRTGCSWTTDALWFETEGEVMADWAPSWGKEEQ